MIELGGPGNAEAHHPNLFTTNPFALLEPAMDAVRTGRFVYEADRKAATEQLAAVSALVREGLEETVRHWRSNVGPRHCRCCCCC